MEKDDQFEHLDLLNSERENYHVQTIVSAKEDDFQLFYEEIKTQD